MKTARWLEGTKILQTNNLLLSFPHPCWSKAELHVLQNLDTLGLSHHNSTSSDTFSGSLVLVYTSGCHLSSMCFTLLNNQIKGHIQYNVTTVIITTLGKIWINLQKERLQRVAEQKRDASMTPLWPLCAKWSLFYYDRVFRSNWGEKKIQHCKFTRMMRTELGLELPCVTMKMRTAEHFEVSLKYLSKEWQNKTGIRMTLFFWSSCFRFPWVSSTI